MTPGLWKWRAAWWQCCVMLEKMAEFFEARLEGYEEHMLTAIEGAEDFYPFTAALLPDSPGSHILDLGCGTGLELKYYFARVPDAHVTGIDLSKGMLAQLRRNFPERRLELRCGSYFELPLGEGVFDGAVSVESLHHFTQAEKEGLYRKLHAALKPGAAFILTDYFAPDDAYEQFYHQELLRLKAEQGTAPEEFYHYDTPLTIAHESQALRAAGFGKIDILAAWGCTAVLRAEK